MKNRTTGYSSDNEQSTTKQQQQDLSILRKPILTSLNGFLEAKRAFENGNEEIRRLLSHECDIMYECKLCRNVFRSLINFISHKRVYCRDIYNNSFDINRHGFIDQDVSTIIQAEEEYTNRHQANNHKSTKKNIIQSLKNNNNNNNNYNNNNNNQQTSNNNLDKSNKDLTSIIERLINSEQKNRTLKLTDFYEQVSLKLTQEEIFKKNHVLQLDGIPNSKAAVYQTIKKEDTDNIKKEICEINDLINCKAILGPDGKLLNTNPFDYVNENLKNTTNITANHNKITNGIENDSNEKNITCEICQLKFLTDKTLKLHLQTKHISSTYVYQCPSCSQTFLQPSAVIKHLSNDHKKSLRRIRQMRETIFKKRIRIDEVQIKGPNRELARLQTNETEKINAENTRAWMDNIERSPRNSPLCSYCGKKFERRAVLTTHLQSCTSKNRQTSPNITNKKINDITSSRENSSTSRSSTSSPANNNSVTNMVTTTANPIITSSLLEFAAKSIANATFEPIKRDDIKSEFCNTNEIFEIVKPNAQNCLNKKINRRKRLKPETIIIRKTESIINKSIEENQNFEMHNLNEMNTKIEPTVSENKIDKFKLSLKEIKKPKLSPSVKIVKDIQINGNIELNENALIPETVQNNLVECKIAKISNSILKKKDFNRDRFLKLITPRKDLIFYCRICKKAFGALSNLRRHISMFHYKRRKFGCHICPYRAFRKYDVVNHLNSAHALTGEQNLDQILVAEDNFGKDDVDGDIIISDNGEFKGEKEEDIENIKADIAKANTMKNKLHIRNENFIIKNSSKKKGRKSKEPYVVKKSVNTAPLDTIDLDVVAIPIKEIVTENVNSDITINAIESLDTIKSDKVYDIGKVEKDLDLNNEESIEKTTINIKRSDSIQSISSNEDRTSSTTTTSSATTTASNSSNIDLSLKRPIRNRVKPVDKDFVYDLPNFFKNDMLCIGKNLFSVGKAVTKRRNTIVNLDDSSRESNSSNSTVSSNSSNTLQIVTDNLNFKDEDSQKQSSKITSVEFSQKSTAENGNIFLNSLINSPLPKEKTITLPSTLLTHLKRGNSVSTPEIAQKNKILNINNGIDKIPPNFTNIFRSFEDLKKVKHVRRTSDDAVIRFFNKKRNSIDISDLATMSDSSITIPASVIKRKEVNVNGTIKKNVSQEDISQNNNLVANNSIEKINNNSVIIKNVPNDFKPILISNKEITTDLQQNGDNEMKNEIRCPNEKDFQEYLITNNLSEPVKKINLSDVIEQQQQQQQGNNNGMQDESISPHSSLIAGGKRITLLQRLTDNKNKKIQESLLRNALEN